MNRNCSCGGRLVPNNTSRLVARFTCDRCGDVREQKKRQPRNNYSANYIEEQFWHDVLIEDIDTSREAVRRAIEYTLKHLGRRLDGRS